MKKPADHFGATANLYAQFRPTYPESLFNLLHASHPGAKRVLDCATGSGQAAAALAKRFPEVWGIDSSARQLTHRAKRENVAYAVAAAEHLPFKDATMDIVTVAQAFHWFQFEEFFQEVRRISRPGAMLAIWCYGHHRTIESTMDPILHQFNEEIIGPYWPKEVKWVREGYQTIPFPFEEVPTEPLWLEAPVTLDGLLGYFRSWSATQRFQEVHGVDPVKELERKLAKLWGDPAIVRTLTWDLHLRIGRIKPK